MAGVSFNQSYFLEQNALLKLLTTGFRNSLIYIGSIVAAVQLV